MSEVLGSDGAGAAVEAGPGIIRPAVTLDVGLPLLLRHVADLRRERGIAISHETVRRCG